MYHRTTAGSAAAIQADGFRDGGTGSYNRGGELSHGVWLADRDMTDAFTLGSVVFTVEIPESVVAPFEWLDNDARRSSWRAFLVPAEIVNEYPRARMVLPPVLPRRGKKGE